MGIFDEIDEFLRGAGNAPFNPFAPAYRAGRGAFNAARVAASPYIDTFGSRSKRGSSRGQRAIRDIGPRGPQRAMQRSPGGAGTDNPLGDLYESLLASLTGNIGVDEADLMSQIRGAYDPVYDARRAAIEDAMARQETRTERGREDVEGMYGALAEDYERLAPEQAAQADEAQAEIEAMYGQLKSNVEGNYSRIAEEQSELFQQLGIEQAAPNVLNPQAESAAKAATRADELGAINEQRYIDIGDIDETYYREGVPLANLTGSNRSADLLEQLQEYMGQRQSDISQLEAERTSGIQSAYSSALMQAQGQAAQQQSQQTGMLWDILQSQMQAQQQDPAEITSGSFMGMLPPQQQAEVANAFRLIERSPEAVYGRTEDPRHPVPGTFVPTTEEWWFNKVDEMYGNQQISEGTRSALMQFLRLYLAEQ